VTAVSITPADESEAALVLRVRAGDRLAFEQVMRRHNRRLFRLARATLRDATEAEDALQEAYLAAYRGFEHYRGESSLSTWLCRLVLNECLARLRRHRRRDDIAHIFVPADPQDLDRMGTSNMEPPDQAALRADMRALLERKVDALPEALRIVFVLRCVEELTVAEVAACLQVPETTVRTRQFRARGLLRESLAHELDMAERDAFEFGGQRCDRIVAVVLEGLDGRDPTGNQGGLP
jgi:RNA polymerase sigma-70 factor (ECF subfamily)